MRWIAFLLLAALPTVNAVGDPPVLRSSAPKSVDPGPPTPREIATLRAEAARTGWGPVAHGILITAVDRYARGVPSAQAWYYLYRWAQLFAATEAEATAEWTEHAVRAKIPYPPFEPEADAAAQPLAALWPEDLRTFALTTPGFSEEAFNLWSPLDQPVMVMRILANIWRKDPAAFREYPGLALAIAVVYDVPPPADWPHRQVSAEALSRRLPAPADAFAFFVKADRSGATLQRLRRLPAADLKFVVDTSASFAELTWAQTKVDAPLAGLDKVYSSIRYRRDRLEEGVMKWPGETYRLADIADQGGICIDQAYFASTVGKAKGVPTLLFRGAGQDSRHAWFAYLDGNDRWQLDCGRGPDQKLVTGSAFDPQTWTAISDHELAFLAEGFRRLPRYNLSRMHAQFATVFFAAGEFRNAVGAARAAVNVEPRNLDAWSTLLLAQQRVGGDPRQFEALVQEAARTFQRYPDVESQFETLLGRSLRARGEKSAADFVQRNAGQKYAGDRGDLNAGQAEEVLQRSLDNEDAGQNIVTYYRVLDTYGRGAGMEFFDRIVRPFVSRLLEQDRASEALQAVEHARRTLRVAPNSQLDVSLNDLAERARQAMH